MKIYGLTGGVGCGKSTVAACFARHGIHTIDADKIGHQVLQPGGAAEAEVRAAFGDTILTGGEIDRTKLAQIVFSDPEARRQLNQITHPAIAAEIARHAAALAEEGQDILLVEAALWGERGQREPWLDGLILVLVPEAMRIERLMNSRSMTREAAAARIAAQVPPESKLALADWVIENDRSEAHLCAQVEALAEVLRGKSGRH